MMQAVCHRDILLVHFALVCPEFPGSILHQCFVSCSPLSSMLLLWIARRQDGSHAYSYVRPFNTKRVEIH